MTVYDTVTLIGDETAKGVYDEPNGARREVCAEIRSVWMNEAYTAMAHGLTPDFTAVLSFTEEYAGEKRLMYRGNLYDVIRVFINRAEGVELTCQRRLAQAAGGERHADV